MRTRSRLAQWVGVGLAVAAAVLPSSAAEAQQPGSSNIVVVGQILDVQQGAPVSQARIQFFRILEDLPVEVAAAQPPDSEILTDPAGSFRTQPLVPSSYRVVITALGYRDFTQEIEVSGASPMDLAIQLVPEAMELDAIVVRGVRSPWLAASGFYDRRERGLGRTFTREELQQRSTTRITDVFRTVAGVNLVSAGAQNRPYITFRNNCLPDIIIDGLNLGHQLRLDELIGAHEIEGIEIYRGSATPLEYSTSGCGAVVVWSIDPSAQEGGEPFSFRRMVTAAVFVTVSLLIGR